MGGMDTDGGGTAHQQQHGRATCQVVVHAGYRHCAGAPSPQTQPRYGSQVGPQPRRALRSRLSDPEGAFVSDQH